MNGIERVASPRVLAQAREYNAPLLMFLRSDAGLTRTGFTCTVLDVGTEHARRLILSTPLRRTTPYPLHAGDALEFFFEIAGVGYAFPGVVRERVRYALNERRTVSALLFDFPPDLLKIQRRAHYRATPPPDPPVPVRLRPVSDQESPEDRLFATEYPYEGRMLDISGSGIAVEMQQPLVWEPAISKLVAVSFRLSAEDANAIVLDTRVRGITDSAGGEATHLHLAWVNCAEEDEVTGAFATRIFRYVAERQRALGHERRGRR